MQKTTFYSTPPQYPTLTCSPYPLSYSSLSFDVPLELKIQQSHSLITSTHKESLHLLPPMAKRTFSDQSWEQHYSTDRNIIIQKTTWSHVYLAIVDSPLWSVIFLTTGFWLGLQCWALFPSCGTGLKCNCKVTGFFYNPHAIVVWLAPLAWQVSMAAHRVHS